LKALGGMDSAVVPSPRWTSLIITNMLLLLGSQRLDNCIIAPTGRSKML
jgi:hypothetical protein